MLKKSANVNYKVKASLPLTPKFLVNINIILMLGLPSAFRVWNEIFVCIFQVIYRPFHPFLCYVLWEVQLWSS
jgi:hypothetical protein